MQSIEITLNGEQRVIRSQTVAGLLTELELSGKRVAVELNREIVRREQFDSTKLASGDAVEVVHFVGGG